MPPTLSARVRLLGSGRSDKTDSHDPRAAAVVALRHRSLRSVRAEDHVTMLRRSSRAREENRTPDLRITSALLCRLSYSGGKDHITSARQRGLKPLFHLVSLHS